MIKNIVFDIGNVLVTFDPYSYFVKYFKDEEKTKQLCHYMFQDKTWLQYDQGILFKKDLENIYNKKYPKYKDDLVYMLYHWEYLMKDIPEMQVFMHQLKEEGYHLYILSNISKDSADYIKHTYSIFSMIDGSILSYEYKMLKPNEEIYKQLLSKYNLEANSCVFLDDKEENIDIAIKLGMKGIVFHNPKQAWIKLRKIIDSEGNDDKK